MYILIFWYYIPSDPGHTVLGFETFFMNDFQYGHFLDVNFNTICFLFGVIFKKFKFCNLITSAKIVIGVKIVVEG